MGRLDRFSLRMLLIGGAVLATAVPAVALGIVSAWTARSLVLERATERYELLAKGVAAEYEQFLRAHLHALDAVARQAAGTRPFTEERFAPILAAVKPAYPALTGVVLSDASGRAVAADPPKTPEGQRIAGTDLSPRPFFREMVRRREPFAETTVRIGGVYKRPIVVLAAPVLDAFGGLRGIVSAGLDLEETQRIAARVTLGSTGAAEVATGGGLLVAHGRGEDAAGQTDASTRPIWPHVTARESGRIPAYVGSRGDTRMAGFATVPGVGWKVWAGQSVSEVEREVWAAYRSVGWWVLVAVAITLVPAALLAAAIARPVHTLRDTATAIAKGDLECRAPETGPRDVAILARAFNGMTAALRDHIVQRHRGAEALTEANHRLQALIQGSPLGILVIQNDETVTLWNPAAERIFGWSESEVLGRPYPLVPEGKRDEFRALFARGRRGDPIAGVELRRQRKDGSLVDVRMFTAPLRDAEGTIVADMAVYEDITQRKRAAELQQAKEAAEAANRAKSEFLSRMSHELRTPLNAILGFAQLLQMDAHTPEQRESVKHILKGGRHLLDLINEVLDIARIETGRLHLSPEPVPVGDLLREALDLIRPLATESGIHLHLGPVPAEDGHVQADRQRLKQVFLNLLANAVKYNREGGAVTVACELIPGDGLRITVRDEGPGIPAALMARLFTPFDRLGAEATSVEGTGLGLALSKRLVEAMGGTLSVESSVGRGSTFWVELPLAEGPLERLGHAADDPAGPSGQAGTEGTVLYIEDNLSNLRLVERVLAHRPGVRLVPAMQGRLGLALAREHRPDLILLDLHLPDVPGDEVLGRLRADGRTASIPVVILSADAALGQVARLTAAGARGYLSKPLDVRELLALLDETLSRPGRRPVLPCHPSPPSG